jgi:type I restriction enzyme M protein
MANSQVNGSVGFEQQLWQAADKLRNSMDAAEYKHVVLGLIFLKYISDAFEEKYNELAADPQADPEDRDEYLADNVFWVVPEARWRYLVDHAKQPTIGQIIDNAMIAIEKDNESLKGVLSKNYARPDLDKTKLGELIDTLSFKIGDKVSQEMDVLGRVYEYFLGKFAAAEGKLGGEFFTPLSVVRTLVEMLEPYSGRIYDPCCGSGGMFVQSSRFVKEHQGNIGSISIYGQESNPTTWRLAKMNLAIRGLDGNLGQHNADTFHNDLHKTLKADFILANPPFNISDWGGDRLIDDQRWQGYGIPPAGNANYAWILHMLSKLAPNGTAGFVLANGSMSTSTTAEYEIRKNLIEKDHVDCIVTLPGQLFLTTQIPVCLWFITRNKSENGHRARKGETLFIDARKLGTMEDRTHRILTNDDIGAISSKYHAWRNKDGQYEDVKGFCKAASLQEIRDNDYVLTPGRYVGIEDVENDGEPFEEKMARLTSELTEMFTRSKELEDDIKKNMGSIGYEL